MGNNTEKETQTVHRCFRCNHHLTKPESIKEGLGPVCVLKQIHELVINKMVAMKGSWKRRR